MGTLIIFGLGLVIGWNILPQPLWVKAIYDRVAKKFSK